MNSDELVANIFRMSLTKQKLKNENIKGEESAKKAHYKVGKKVRETIEELGGTVPEKMPVPNKSIKEIKNKLKGEL